jgi:hypothetical protein
MEWTTCTTRSIVFISSERYDTMQMEQIDQQKTHHRSGPWWGGEIQVLLLPAFAFAFAFVASITSTTELWALPQIPGPATEKPVRFRAVFSGETKAAGARRDEPGRAELKTQISWWRRRCALWSLRSGSKTSGPAALLLPPLQTPGPVPPPTQWQQAPQRRGPASKGSTLATVDVVVVHLSPLLLNDVLISELNPLARASASALLAHRHSGARRGRGGIRVRLAVSSHGVVGGGGLVR